MLLTKYVQDWFKRADDDLYSAGILLKEGGIPNTICFLSQQAAEKYLKGLLAFHEINIRKIHNLEALLVSCIEIDRSFEELKGEAMFLTKFYTEARYPTDIPEFSLSEAQKALESATRIKNFVLEKTS